MTFEHDPKCPKCGGNMTYGASHTGPGLQGECHNCGYIEQVSDENHGDRIASDR
jgi:DNA-directed RNA polymerase subunit M/transcription elongation factor TFIIS